MLMSRRQNAEQNRDIQIAGRSFEIVVEFRYPGTAITNQNLILEEIKGRLNSGNAWLPFGPKLSSHLASCLKT
jgi:hypothetical protein